MKQEKTASYTQALAFEGEEHKIVVRLKRE